MLPKFVNAPGAEQTKKEYRPKEFRASDEYEEQTDQITYAPTPFDQ
tara:strand:- start:36 stop:173 length:138 start_codon:yes stop_codon:yes gene_type:complete